MKKFLPIAVCALFLSAGVAQSQIVVRIGPPPHPVERIPPPPHEHPSWAWHSGYHRWDGHDYVWVPGYYVEPPHPYAVWVAKVTGPTMTAVTCGSKATGASQKRASIPWRIDEMTRQGIIIE